MEKDNLPEWLKFQAQDFKLTPPEGGFTVLMRKREQQRKQRKRLLWIGLSSAAMIVIGTIFWFVGSLQSISSPKVTVSAQQTSNGINQTSTVNQATQYKNQTNTNDSQPAISSSERGSRESALISSATIKKVVQVKTDSETQEEFVSLKNNVPTSVMSSSSSVNGLEGKNVVAVAINDSVAFKQPIDSLSNKESADSNDQSTAKETTVSPALARESYWSVSAVFTPQIMNSVYNANSDATLSWMKKYIENREQNDKALYSFNAGIRMARHIGPHWSISGGLLYSKVQFEEIRIVNTIIPDSTGNDFGNLTAADKNNRITQAEQNSFDISFTSLEFPVQVSYQFQRNNIYCQLSAGVAYSYLFQTRSLVFDPSDSLNVQETDDAGNNRLNQHSVLLMGGINIGYQLSPKWSLFAGPVYRYSIHSIYSKDYIIRQQPYYLGLELGVKYSFR